MGERTPMNYHRYFHVNRPPVETCIVGIGSFGRSFLAQGLRVPMMRARISIDRDAEVAAEGLRTVGSNRGASGLARRRGRRVLPGTLATSLPPTIWQSSWTCPSRS